MSAFDNAEKYDSWYDRNKEIYEKELNLILSNIQDKEKIRGLEVGVGTGRFACKLNAVGLDISMNMLKVAKKRGVEVVLADADYLPFKDEKFDFVLFAFTLCFLKKPFEAISEAKRVLKEKGTILVCFIPEGKLAKEYKSKSSQFYREAKFYKVEEVVEMLENAGFSVKKVEFLYLKYGRDIALVKALR